MDFELLVPRHESSGFSDALGSIALAIKIAVGTDGSRTVWPLEGEDSNRRYRGRRPAAAACRFLLCLISRQLKFGANGPPGLGSVREATSGCPRSKSSGKVRDTHSVGSICDFDVFTVTNIATENTDAVPPAHSLPGMPKAAVNHGLQGAAGRECR